MFAVKMFKRTFACLHFQNYLELFNIECKFFTENC